MVTALFIISTLIITYILGRKSLKQDRTGHFWFIVFSLISLVLSIQYALNYDLAAITKILDSLFSPVTRMVVK